MSFIDKSLRRIKEILIELGKDKTYNFTLALVI